MDAQNTGHEIMSDAFVENAFEVMKNRQATQGQLQIETAREIFYQHGLIASNDELHALMLRIRRKYAHRFEDTGI